jgi:hypothetical protein
MGRFIKQFTKWQNILRSTVILSLIFECGLFFRRILSIIITFWVRPPCSFGVTGGATTEFLSWNIIRPRNKISNEMVLWNLPRRHLPGRHLPTDKFAQKTFLQCLSGNCHPGKCFSGQMSSVQKSSGQLEPRQMYLRANVLRQNVFRANVSPGKVISGQMSSGQMSSGQMSFGQMSSGQMYLRANVRESLSTEISVLWKLTFPFGEGQVQDPQVVWEKLFRRLDTI